MNTVDMYPKRMGPYNGSPGFGIMHEPTKSPPYMMQAPPMMPRYGMIPGSPPMMGLSPASSTSTFASPPPPPHLSTPSPQAMHSPEGKNDPPKRLRYWLVDMINSGSIPELRWEDESKTVFRIPWKHAGKNNWKEEDCKIFKAWAEHRGKYKEGVDKFDPATWKTRLRCALNKLPDIKELKDRSQLEGTDPYRVYQLLPEPEKNQDIEIYPRSQWIENTPTNEQKKPKKVPTVDDDGNLRYDPHANQMKYNQYQRPQEGAAPTMKFSQLHVGQKDYQNGYDESKIEISPPEDLPESDYEFQNHSIKPRPPVQDPMMPAYNDNRGMKRRNDFGPPMVNRNDVPMQMTPRMDRSPGGVASPAEIEQANHNMDQEQSYFTANHMHSQMISHSDTSPAPYEMYVNIKYKGVKILSHHVTNQAGCRIHYGNSGLQHIATVTHELPSHLFGPQDLFQIELVDCEHYALSEKQVNLTKHLLKNVQRGLILSFVPDGSIVAKRLCQSRVFYISPETCGKEPEKLERNKPTKMFDYRNFCNHLKRYAAEQCSSPPSMEIKMSFGQTWSMKNPLDKNLISVVVVPSAANFLLQKVRERNNTLFSINNSLQASGPSSDDRLVERVTRDSEEYVDELISQLVQDDGMRYPGHKPYEDPFKPQYYPPPDVDMEVSAFKVN